MAIINQEQVEDFNSQLNQKKSTNPVLRDITPQALDLAIGQARQEVLPGSFGAAMFEIPEGKDPNEYIDLITTNIVETAVEKFNDLSYQTPEYLSGWIQNQESFKNSRSYTELRAITRTEFNRIEEGISDLEIAETPEFENPDLNKLSSKSLQDLLNSTVIGFLREIGIERSEATKRNDDFILSNAQRIFDQLTKATEQQTQAVQTEVETPSSITVANPTNVLPSQEQETTSPEEQNIATPVQSITQEPRQEIAVNVQQQPTVIEQAQTNVTNITNQSQQTGTFGSLREEGESVGSSPLLSMLGNRLGMSESEIAGIFTGGSIESFDQAVANSFGGVSEMVQEIPQAAPVVEAAISKVAEIPQNIVRSESIEGAGVEQSMGNLVSQTIGITEQAVVSQQEPRTQEQNQESPKNQAIPETPVQSGVESPKMEENKESSPDSGKTEESGTLKEGEQSTNTELLRVMREILKVLQGPLIVTDSTHKFS